MDVITDTAAWTEAIADWLVVPIFAETESSTSLTQLDEALGGQISRLGESEDFTGKHAETLALRDVPAIKAKRLLLVGLGKPAELDTARFDKTIMIAARQASDKENVTVAVAIPDATAAMSTAACARLTATALQVGCVGQDLFRAKPGHFSFDTATILSDAEDDQTAIDEAVERGSILGECINITRELVNLPAQDVYPESFAAKAEELAAKHGFSCDIFDEDRLHDEKMNTMLAVANGSDRPARMVVAEYRGASDKAPTLALVGKGVTFDSGGLSLKTSEGMKTMKCDMAGAATVIGAVTAIARLKLPVNVTGFMGLVENMVSGSSYKLGDVLTARNGTTIEVLNTDAEGRLVLADVLSYAADQNVDKMIDLATLTGACVVALGEDVTGAFTNDKQWCDSVVVAAQQAGENIWQMPMFELFGELIKSDVADIKNIGGRWGGAITAAKFLEKFVGEKPWVHLDIAGPSFASSNKSHREGGGTGCMLQTLVETAANFS